MKKKEVKYSQKTIKAIQAYLKKYDTNTNNKQAGRDSRSAQNGGNGKASKG